MENKKLLVDSGLTKNEAKILNYVLEKKQDIHSRHLEHELDLRQPEASIVLNEFIGRDWISYEKKSDGGKGRPMHVYALAKDKQDIISDLVKHMMVDRALIDKTIKGLEDWKNS